MTETTEILKERGKRYGRFDGHANVTQRLKQVIATELHIRRKKLANDQQEALDMICHKIGRIINGDANYEDSWRDIAGYAQLVADRLLEPANATPVCGDTAVESVKDVWDYTLSESGKAAINALREQRKEELLKSSAPEQSDVAADSLANAVRMMGSGWKLVDSANSIIAKDDSGLIYIWYNGKWFLAPQLGYIY